MLPFLPLLILSIRMKEIKLCESGHLPVVPAYSPRTAGKLLGGHVAWVWTQMQRAMRDETSKPPSVRRSNDTVHGALAVLYTAQWAQLRGHSAARSPQPCALCGSGVCPHGRRILLLSMPVPCCWPWGHICVEGTPVFKFIQRSYICQLWLEQNYKLT